VSAFRVFYLVDGFTDENMSIV